MDLVTELQDAILPTGLPVPRGARLAGRYLLAPEDGGAGGDWFDAVPLRAAVAINSVSSIMLNKLDILSGLPHVGLCVAYRIDGQTRDDWPFELAELERAEPVYETFDGWDDDCSGARRYDELRRNARAFVDALEARAGVPIAIVSVGPERTQTILRGPRAGRHRTTPASAVA